MKRWMGYLLALMLTASMILSGASFAEESDAAKTLEAGKDFQYAVAQDRVWVVTQDGVAVYDGSMETQVSSYYNKVVSTPTFGRDKNDLEGEGA